MKKYDDRFKDNRQLENNSTSINVTFLHSGSRYTFEVSAMTGGGEGESVSISIDVPESGLTHICCFFLESNHFFI